VAAGQDKKGGEAVGDDLRVVRVVRVSIIADFAEVVT
jgi:hypothetical protein